MLLLLCFKITYKYNVLMPYTWRVSCLFFIEMHRYRYRHTGYRYIDPKITISVSVLL